MKLFSRFLSGLAVIFFGISQSYAATTTVNFSGVFDYSVGIAGINGGDSFSGSFTYDLDPANAIFIDTTILSGFTDYGFNGPSYNGSISSGVMNYAFPDVEYMIGDNFSMLADMFYPGTPAGTFDLVLLGGSPSNFEFTLTGMASMLVLVGEQSLFSGNGLNDINSLISDPAYIGAGLLLFNFNGTVDADGDPVPVGDAFGFAEVTPVPVPAAVWLFGSGLLGLMGFMRRKQ
ncbi:MAG: PEP-CTERM sorting domain-containing protein [Gammaproteobacteria bacterium]|nr:PEP-CTERM sorting domain-containing protein [Gammaproteobacteria bacterium]